METLKEERCQKCKKAYTPYDDHNGLCQRCTHVTELQRIVEEAPKKNRDAFVDAFRQYEGKAP